MVLAENGGARGSWGIWEEETAFRLGGIKLVTLTALPWSMCYVVQILQPLGASLVTQSKAREWWELTSDGYCRIEEERPLMVGIHLLLQETQETRVPSLGREDPLEKETATHSSILAWRIPWTEEPEGLQPLWSQRVGQDSATTNTQETICQCRHRPRERSVSLAGLHPLPEASLPHVTQAQSRQCPLHVILCALLCLLNISWQNFKGK